MATFKFLQYVDIGDIAELVKIHQQVIEWKDERIDFDFSEIHSISPFLACFIAKLLKEGSDRGQAGIVSLPEHEPARLQFHQMELDKFLSERITTKNEHIPTVPIQQITSSRKSVTDKIVKLVAEQMVLPHWISESIYFAIHELLLNITNHCGVQLGNYICANTIPEKQIIQICVLDSGIGILQSLKKNQKYAYLTNDIEAIHKSLEYGVTSIKDEERGIGLDNLLQLIRSNKGEMQIVSGTGMISILADEILDKILQKYYQGTIVNVVLNIDEGFRPRFNDWEAGLDKWVTP